MIHFKGWLRLTVLLSGSGWSRGSGMSVLNSSFIAKIIVKFAWIIPSISNQYFVRRGSSLYWNGVKITPLVTNRLKFE